MIEETKTISRIFYGDDTPTSREMDFFGWVCIHDKVDVTTHEHTYGGEVSYTGKLNSDGDIKLTKHVSPYHTSISKTYAHTITYKRVFKDVEHMNNVKNWENRLNDTNLSKKDVLYYTNLCADSFGIDVGVLTSDIKEFSYVKAEKESKEGLYKTRVILFPVLLAIDLLIMGLLFIFKKNNLENFVNYNKGISDEHAYELVEQSWNIFIRITIVIGSLLLIAFIIFFILKMLNDKKVKAANEVIHKLRSRKTNQYSLIKQELQEELKKLKMKDPAKWLLKTGIVFAVLFLLAAPGIPSLVKNAPKHVLRINLLVIFLFLGIGVILITIYLVRNKIIKNKIKEIEKKLNL